MPQGGTSLMQAQIITGLWLGLSSPDNHRIIVLRGYGACIALKRKVEGQPGKGKASYKRKVLPQHDQPQRFNQCHAAVLSKYQGITLKAMRYFPRRLWHLLYTTSLSIRLIHRCLKREANLKIVLGSQAAQKCSSASAPFGASSPLPVLFHCPQHLPGSSRVAHLLSLLKDTNYASLYYGDPFHSNTLQGQSRSSHVVSPCLWWPSPCLARNTQVEHSLSCWALSVCMLAALTVLTGSCWHQLSNHPFSFTYSTIQRFPL